MLGPSDVEVYDSELGGEVPFFETKLDRKLVKKVECRRAIIHIWSSDI